MTEDADDAAAKSVGDVGLVADLVFDEAEVGAETSLDLEDDASAKSSGRFKARKTSTISS